MIIQDKFLTLGAARPGNIIKPEGVVVHYVGNPGSSALSNRNYFENGAGGASAHYIVGLQGEVLRCIPENEQANHAGKSYGAKWDASQNNKKYIGIENCHVDTSGKFGTATYIALIELISDIFKRYGWTDVDTRLLRHYDVCGKSCPLYYVNNPAAWNALKTDVKNRLNAPEKTPIQGKSELTASQLAAFLTSRNNSPKINCLIDELARLYMQEGEIEYIRGDIAFCQALWETGNFNYGGQVPPEANNYCGLGAFNGTTKYASFKTPQEGVRAHIQHLKAYASRDNLKAVCVDPRFTNARALAVCPNWEDLNGKWAVPGDGYGENIVKLWQSAKAFKGMLKNPYTVRVVASSLNVRKGAGTSFDVVQTVKKGDVFTIVEEKDGWGKLKSGVGWISLDLVVKN